MTIGERVKAIRKASGVKVSQGDFARPLGVKSTAISRIENGERGLTDQMILTICRVYGVSEKWLRTGEGEMFVRRDRSERLTQLVNSMLADRDDLDASFRGRLVTAILELTPEQLAAAEDFAKKLLAEQQGGDVELDIEAELADYRRQLEVEKSQEAGSCQSHASGE